MFHCPVTPPAPPPLSTRCAPTCSPTHHPLQPEYHELYSRFAGIYEAEEAQRSTLWGAYLRDLREAVGDGCVAATAC